MLTNLVEEENLLEKLLTERNIPCKWCNSKTRKEKNKETVGLRCTWSLCKKRMSLWEGSILKNSKIGPNKTLQLIKLWLQGVAPRHICQIIGIKGKAYSRFITLLRSSVVSKFYKNVQKIGAPKTIVEVDESKFGKRKHNRGHMVEGVWVVGAVERTSSRKIYLQAVPNRTSPTLTKLLKESVHAQSLIYTDCWKGYSDLKNHFTSHATVNHSRYFVDPISRVHTNTIEGNWSAIKRSIPIRCRTQALVSLYLVRFMILRN